VTYDSNNGTTISPAGDAGTGRVAAAGCGGAHVAPMHAGRTVTLGTLAVVLLGLAIARRRARHGLVFAAAGALLVAAVPDPAPAGTPHTVAATHTTRVAGLLVTRADVVDGEGRHRTIELAGGREGDFVTRVHDAPSGSDLVPGAVVELDGDTVVRVRAAAAR
jgi:hypothetical protein